MNSDFEVAHRTSVSPERLPGWLIRFAERHGDFASRVVPDALWLTAQDGARARLVNRWEPCTAGTADDFVVHVGRPRLFGLLLVRKGADAVGVAAGGELIAHRVSTHHVQGRTGAGGWSQQRYARRRANQTARAYRSAADDAWEVLVPHLAGLVALVTGGDRAGVLAVLADPRLAKIAGLAQRHPILPVPEARLTVLVAAAQTARKVPIELNAGAIVRHQAAG